MAKLIVLALCLAYVAAERIGPLDRETPQQNWERRHSVTSDPYDRYDRVTPKTYTNSWDRDNDRYTTRSAYTFSWERDPTTRSWRDRDSDYDRRTTNWRDRDDFDRRTTYRGSYLDRYTTVRPGVAWDVDTDSFGRRTTSRWGSGSSWDRTTARTPYNPNEAYVNITVKLEKLYNDKGLTADGSKCDTFGSCDPLCTAYLDTERPNSEAPGARDFKLWHKVLQIDDVNSPTFNTTISKEICGLPYREANLRVRCEDRDSTSSNDLINIWSCPINRLPTDSESYATWSPIQECIPKHQPKNANDMRLTFKYKIFSVPSWRCGEGSAGRSAGSTRV